MKDRIKKLEDNFIKKNTKVRFVVRFADDPPTKLKNGEVLEVFEVRPFDENPC
jgi:hypothetical protein